MATKAEEDKVIQPCKTETAVSQERADAIRAWVNAGHDVQRLEQMKNNGLPVKKSTMRMAYELHARLGDKLKSIGQ